MENRLEPAISTLGCEFLTIEYLNAIANWCDALHGNMPLGEAFAKVAKVLGAEAGLVLRTQAQGVTIARVAHFDDQPQRDGARQLTRSFARSHFGRSFEAARTGSIWAGTCFEDSSDAIPDPALRIFQGERKMREFVAIVLATGPQSTDHLELHFRQEYSDQMAAAIAVVTPILVKTWSNRKNGLVTEVVSSNRLLRGNQTNRRRYENIMSDANPARLSRAEFRVCLLLSRGLSVRGISSELALTDATVRTHLRNIYAKTDASGLSALVHLILSETPSRAAQDVRYAS